MVEAVMTFREIIPSPLVKIEVLTVDTTTGHISSSYEKDMNQQIGFE